MGDRLFSDAIARNLGKPEYYDVAVESILWLFHNGYIDLSEDEQEYIYQCINESYDCEQLLKNCADYWKEDIGELTILERRP